MKIKIISDTTAVGLETKVNNFLAAVTGEVSIQYSAHGNMMNAIVEYEDSVKKGRATKGAEKI